MAMAATIMRVGMMTRPDVRKYGECEISKDDKLSKARDLKQDNDKARMSYNLGKYFTIQK